MADIDRCATIADFDEFYAAYPKKKGKLAAQRRWKLMKERPPLAVLLAAIKAQKKSKQWLQDNGRYIKHPATWLHDGAWEDEVEEQKQAEHAERLAENRPSIGLVEQIEAKFKQASKSRYEQIREAWEKLSPQEVRIIIAKHKVGIKFKGNVSIGVIQAWWWNRKGKLRQK